jgi:site-specific DNA-methyltransferase (adenine-specific)
MDYTLHHGDCLEVMATMVDNSVDAIVTDPPYGLSFMGKRWDYDVPSVEVWYECLRVLKPGGHLLAFAGTRTQHRMAVRIEDAGFEIRDMIAWVYGSGFPKSLDVSKAIDKAAGAERQVVGSRKLTGTARIKGQAAFGATSGRSEEAYRDGSEISDTLPITAPATPEAQQWAGWGTALKPALEPITVARKPLTGTVAANVMEHGTGALNVDGCRVGANDGYTENAVTQGINTAQTSYVLRRERRTFEPSANGRWPANLIHDGSEEVVGLFPQTTSGDLTPYLNQSRNGHAGVNSEWKTVTRTGDSGSAARFFYCAKASKADRGEGNTHPTVKPTGLMRYLCRLVTPPGGIVLDPFMGSGSTGKAAILEGFRFIGIERDAEYLAIAEARISHASGLSQPPQRPTRQPAPASPGQLALF